MNGLAGLFSGLHAAAPTVRRRQQPWGKGTGRAAYDVVQRRRAANRRAKASRRINRGQR